MAEKANISPAIQKLISYNNHFAMYGNFMLIHYWLEQGCDMEKDILPAFTEIMQRKPDVSRVEYFQPLVFKKRDNRMALEKAKAPKAIDPDPQRARAKAIAFKRKVKIFINQTDEEFIASYEQHNGKVYT